jgi:hypothetical protein
VGKELQHPNSIPPTAPPTSCLIGAHLGGWHLEQFLTSGSGGRTSFRMS